MDIVHAYQETIGKSRTKSVWHRWCKVFLHVTFLKASVIVLGLVGETKVQVGHLSVQHFTDLGNFVLTLQYKAICNFILWKPPSDKCLIYFWDTRIQLMDNVQNVFWLERNHCKALLVQVLLIWKICFGLFNWHSQYLYYFVICYFKSDLTLNENKCLLIPVYEFPTEFLIPMSYLLCVIPPDLGRWSHSSVWILLSMSRC